MQNNEYFKQIMFWAAIIIGVVLVVAGMIYLVNLQQNAKPPEIVLEKPIVPEDWVKGNKDAKVVVTEYADFQCPACAAYHSLLTQLTTEFGDRVAFVYRHFPLPIHRNAIPMAIASEAAGKQGKFWEMHAMIFENQKTWENSKNTSDIVVGYATKLELNIEQFKKDIASPELEQKIDTAISDGNKIGIGYTPSFFINGKIVANPQSSEEFSDLLTKALNDNK